MSQTIADLIRRGLAPASSSPEAASPVAIRLDERTGLPLIRSPRPVTADDVRALKDE